MPSQQRPHRLDPTRSPGPYRLVLAGGDRDGSGNPIDEEASNNSLFRAKWSQNQGQTGWQSSLDLGLVSRMGTAV
jgi:hypothetical protein